MTVAGAYALQQALPVGRWVYPEEHLASIGPFIWGNERDPQDVFTLNSDIWDAWPYATNPRESLRGQTRLRFNGPRSGDGPSSMIVVEGEPRTDTRGEAAHIVGLLLASASHGATVKELRASTGVTRERSEAACEYLLEPPSWVYTSSARPTSCCWCWGSR